MSMRMIWTKTSFIVFRTDFVEADSLLAIFKKRTKKAKLARQKLEIQAIKTPRVTLFTLVCLFAATAPMSVAAMIPSWL